METALMSNFGRKAAIAAVAFATVGSTVFGGAALAGDKKDGKDGKAPHSVSDLQDATASANGGTNNCLNGIPVLSGNAIAVGGAAEVCSADGGTATALNLLGL
jgi:hypothetical protein